MQLRKRDTKAESLAENLAADIIHTVPDETKTKPPLNILRHLFPESILGYIWWSTFFSLAPTIWFYPLNALELSGYEAFALLLLSPILTCVPFIDKFTTSPYGVSLNQLLTVVGILSYQSPTTLSRLIGTSVANFFAMLWLAGTWWYPDREYRSVSYWGMVIGFFLKLILQIAGTSLNPIWSSSKGNLIFFGLGLICVADRFYWLYRNHEKNQLNKSKTSPSFFSWFPVGVGAGAWFFFAQWIFGEVSVVSRWTSRGYPNLGMPPNPAGEKVLASLAIGIALSTLKFTTTIWWWLFGCIGAYMFYYTSPFTAFCGGLILALYIMSVFPRIANQMSACSKSKTLSLALFVWIIIMLASVWVVAYNFVPGGVYTRERNDVLLGLSMVLIGLAVCCNVKSTQATDKNKDTKSYDADANRPKIAFVLFGKQKRCVFKNYVIPVIICLTVIGMMLMGGRFYQREQKRRLQKQVNSTKVFSAMIWTVHFGFDNNGWPSFDRAAELMKNTEADVIGILESDCSRPYLGSTDLVMSLEEKLGFYSDYGPSTKDHTWGAAILSRYPIIKSTHYLLSSPEGELAPAVSTSVNISGQIVDFVVVHMGNDRDDLDRELQAQELAEIMDKSSNPVVFLGYVTSAPGSRDYRHLLEAGRTKDIDSTDYYRWCEYIFYRQLARLGYARISKADLSDTEIQIAKFRIPDNLSSFVDNEMMTSIKEDVDKSVRFSEKFGDFHDGDYYGKGHHFHMSTPKYFLP